LTGSSTPNHKGVLHSGTGRISRIAMRPMSLFESGDSNGHVSIMALFNALQPDVSTGNVELMHLINLTVRGGWPAAIGVPTELAFELPKSYMDAVVQDDVFRIDDIKRDKRKMQLLLRSLARNESTTATNKKLHNDIKDVDNLDIDLGTIAEYLNVFERLFILDNQRPFATNVRSSVRVKQSEKRHLADPSLACALLGATPSMLINDLQTFGFVFEALCERDLKIYAQTLGGQLYHYQDYKNDEIDAVIQLPDGRWGCFEIKLGFNQIDEAAENLLRIQTKFDKKPALLAVVCGMSNAAFKRPDGVYVIPITALKP
jgi:predicted AAA+ superfamily ATPase